MFSGLSITLKGIANNIKNAVLPHQEQEASLLLDDLRCMKCDKLLGRVKGEALIKCVRCKTFNSIKN